MRPHEANIPLPDPRYYRYLSLRMIRHDAPVAQLDRAPAF